MDELEARLRAVLNDPQAMAEVSRLASGLLGPSGEGAPAGGPPPPAGGAPPGGGPLSGGGPLPGIVGELLRGSRGGHPIASALAPYLREDRRRRLERALGVASAARLAEKTLQQMGGWNHGV